MRSSFVGIMGILALTVPGCATMLSKPSFAIPPTSAVTAIRVTRIASDSSVVERIPEPASPVISDRLRIERIMEFLAPHDRVWQTPFGTPPGADYCIEVESRNREPLNLYLKGTQFHTSFSGQVRTLSDAELRVLVGLLGIGEQYLSGSAGRPTSVEQPGAQHAAQQPGELIQK